MKYLLIAALAVGCGGGTSDRCEDLWKKGEAAVKQMGGAPPPGEHEKFVGQCRIVAKEDPSCLDDSASPKCKDLLARAADQASPAKHVDIAWQSQSVLGDRATALVPGGWTDGDHARNVDEYFNPSGAFELVSFALRATCADDACTAQPAAAWAKIVDATIAALHTADTTVAKDETIGAAGRIAIVMHPTEDRGRAVIDAFAWQDGGQVLYECRAELDRTAVANLDDFEKACRSLAPKSFAPIN